MMKSMNGGQRLKAGPAISRQILFVVLGAGLILLVPWLAMQFTGAVAWSPFDFALSGALLMAAGVTYVLAARVVSKPQYRLILGVGLAALLVLLWVELAVGVFGSPFAGS